MQTLNLPAEAHEPVQAAATTLGCAPAILAAVLHRESGHLRGAARLAARRFEPHVFRRLGGGLAATHAGAVRLDPELAEQASSHGAPQIMGFHHRMLGYASASAMRAAFLAGGWPEQMQAMRLYAEKSGMASPLRALDMAGIARIYNGPAFSRNGYDLKLAADYARFAGKAPARLLRLGDQGDEVRQLQVDLGEAGHITPIDGVFGPLTEHAVLSFQQAQGLKVDGVVGAKTWDALGRAGFLEATEDPPTRPELEADRLWRHRGKALTGLAATLAAARDTIIRITGDLGVDTAQALRWLWDRLSGLSFEGWALLAVLLLLAWPRLSPALRRLERRFF